MHHISVHDIFIFPTAACYSTANLLLQYGSLNNNNNSGYNCGNIPNTSCSLAKQSLSGGGGGGGLGAGMDLNSLVSGMNNITMTNGGECCKCCGSRMGSCSTLEVAGL